MVSVVAGSVLLLPMAIIGLLIVLESPGPAIFRQKRIGKDGKVVYVSVGYDEKEFAELIKAIDEALK